MKNINKHSIAFFIAFFSFMALTASTGCAGREAEDKTSIAASDDNTLTQYDDENKSTAVTKSEGSILHLNDKNFETTISSGIVVVDFWATWCKPCLMQAPILEKVKTAMGDNVVIGKVDVDENPAIADKFGIQSIPTILIFKDGKLVEKFVGLTAQETLTTAINKQRN